MNWYEVLYFIFLFALIIFICVTIAGAAGMAWKSPAEAWMWTLLIVGAVGTVACALFLLYDAHRIEEKLDLNNTKKRKAQNMSTQSANVTTGITSMPIVNTGTIN